MLFCHYSYFKTFSHELPKISQWPCDIVLNLFFSQGPRILFPLPCGGGLGQCFSCGSLEMGSQVLADVCFRSRKGIKRACCGKAAETSAEGREGGGGGRGHYPNAAAGSSWFPLLCLPLDVNLLKHEAWHHSTSSRGKRVSGQPGRETLKENIKTI